MDGGQAKGIPKREGLSTTGKKSELVHRVSDFIETEELESEFGAVAFSDLLVEKPITFEELPSSNWSKTGLPEVSEERVCTYLKRMGPTQRTIVREFASVNADTYTT